MLSSTLTTDEQAEIRRQVRGALESAPAYHRLDSAQRRRLAGDMERVVSALADPGGGSKQVRDRVENSPIAEALSEPRGIGGALTERNENVSANASNIGASAVTQNVKAVAFPAFVASLIKGVFQAIVSSTMEQMQAFTSFLESVVKSTSQFISQISDHEAVNYMNGQFPGAGFSMGGGMGGMGIGMPSTLGVAGDQASLQVQDSGKADLSSWGFPQGFTMNNPTDTLKVLTEAKYRMAQQKQQLLATMVLMGLNRIVVTDGKINAKVKIKVDTSERVRQMTADQIQGRVTEDVTQTSTHTTSHHSMWGSGSTETYTTTESVPLQVGVEQVGQKTISDQNIDSEVKLYGEVQVNFKSETFPLDRLAAPMQIGLVQQRATPADPNKLQSDKKKDDEN